MALGLHFDRSSIGRNIAPDIEALAHHAVRMDLSGHGRSVAGGDLPRGDVDGKAVGEDGKEGNGDVD